jgi:hypothetical protein
VCHAILRDERSSRGCIRRIRCDLARCEPANRIDLRGRELERVYVEPCGTNEARLGLEGIVSKRVESRYRSGRCAGWVKVKNPDYQRR